MLRKSRVKRLIEELRDGSPKTRMRAAYELGETAAPVAIEPLVHALRDGDKKVRWRAAYALGKLGEAGHSKVYDSIIDAFGVEEDWNVRRIIALQLRHAGKRGFDALIKALKDESKFVRRYAAFALGQRGELEAVEYLEELLDDPAPEVRSYAAQALEKIAGNHGHRRDG